MEACARTCRVPPAVEERFSGRFGNCWGEPGPLRRSRPFPRTGTSHFQAACPLRRSRPFPAVALSGPACADFLTLPFFAEARAEENRTAGRRRRKRAGVADRAGIRTGRPVAPNEGAGRSCREKLPDLTVGQLPGEDFCERPGRLSGKTVEAAGRRRTGNDSASGRIRAASGPHQGPPLRAGGVERKDGRPFEPVCSLICRALCAHRFFWLPSRRGRAEALAAAIRQPRLRLWRFPAV